MIGRLSGTLVEKGVEAVLLDVQGVGYELSCPLTVLDQLPPAGQPCTLIVHTHVREDALLLYGFAQPEERRLFRQLIATTGVGPKLALACLSGLTVQAFTQAIVEKNVKRLVTIPGIGKRTAERLILELDGKVHVHRAEAGAEPTAARPSPDLLDLESALRNLGYKAKEVELLIEALGPQAAQMSFEALLREALRRLNTGS